MPKWINLVSGYYGGCS